jgi:hypothetical protein
MKREGFVFRKRSLRPQARTRAAFAALALFLIWGGGCRKITSSPAGDPALEGKVSIPGEARVGAELSVDTTQLDGTGTIIYQWESGESADGDFAPIEGAADAAYTPLEADAGKYIRVTVTREGYTGSVSSNSTPVKAAPEPEPPEPQPPEPGPQPEPELTGIVSITGNAIRRETLTASLELTASPQNEGTGTIIYQWQRGESADGEFAPIEGAAAETYLIVLADKDKYIRVSVTREGYTGGLTSEAKGPVSLPRIGGSVSIKQAEAKVGVELEAVTGELDVDEDGALLFTWWTSESPNSGYTYEGAAGENYTIRAADVGKYIKVNVSDTGYEGDLMSAAAVGPVTKSPISGTVSITGEAKPTFTLTASVQLEGVETRSYQWQRGDTVDGEFAPIEGAADGTYLIDAADAGLWLQVAVKQDGYDGERISDPVKVLPYIRSVTVSGPAGLTPGLSAAYSAVVDVIPDRDEYKGVEWSVDDSLIYPGTTITENGLLTIAQNEDRTSVIVRATSIDDNLSSDPFPVNITTPLSFANYGTLLGFTVNAFAYGEITAGGQTYNGFVLAGAGGNIFYINSDKTGWTRENSSPLSGVDIYDIAFGNGTWVAVGKDGKSAYSTDGVTWTASGDTGLFATNAADIGITYGEIAGKGIFVAVGKGDGGNNSRRLVWSTNGVSWTTAEDFDTSSDIFPCINKIAYGDGRFVAVIGINKTAYSTDGKTWKVSEDTTLGEYSLIAGIAFGNGRFVAQSYFNDSSAWSADGVNWTAGGKTGLSEFSMLYSNTAFGNGRFMTLGSKGKAAWSTDGESWNLADNDSGLNEFRGVAFGGGKFVTSYDESGKSRVASFTFPD